MNIRKYIESLRDHKALLDINCEIDGRLELSALTNLMSKIAGPGLLFTRVKGSRLSVASNLFGSDIRMAFALGHANLESFGKTLKSALISTGGESSSKCLIRLLEPVETAECPTLRINHECDLEALPEIRFWPKEKHSFLTLAVVITRSPESDLQNYGLYRIGIVGSRKLTVNLLPGSGGGEHLRQWRAQGKKMPVAILLGADPALIFAAAASLPQGYSDELFSAYISKSIFQSCRCQTVPLNSPTSGEILIEGWLDTEATLNEGPFGCYTGDYGGSNLCPLINISGISMHSDPVLPVTLAGPLPMEDCWIARANLELIRARLAVDFPEVCSIKMPLETAFHGIYFIKVFDGVASVDEIADRFLSLDYLARIKMLVLLEKEVSLSETNWREFIKTVPTERIWQAEINDLQPVIDSQPAKLQHDSQLIEELITRIDLDANEFPVVKGERCEQM